MEERLEHHALRPEREALRPGGIATEAPSGQKAPQEEAKRVPSDNWKHRSKMMLCGTCMSFVAKLRSNLAERDDHSIGRCRYNAPTLDGWPIVFSDDWCRKHKIDEEKI